MKVRLSSTYLIAMAPLLIVGWPSWAQETKALPTVIHIQLDDDVSSRTAKKGDVFHFHLTSSVSIDGKEVAPVGAIGIGEVVFAQKAGINGLPAGKLVIAAKSISVNGQNIPVGHIRYSVDREFGLTGLPNASNYGVVGAMMLPTQLGEAVVASRSDMTVQIQQNQSDIAPSHSGKVVFYRPSMMGMANPCTVYENDIVVSPLGARKYFEVNVAPGLHAFKIKGISKDEVVLQIDADEIYYVKCNAFFGGSNLSPSDADDFNKALPTMGRIATVGSQH